MRASDLMKHLAKAIEAHGDLEVTIVSSMAPEDRNTVLAIDVDEVRFGPSPGSERMVRSNYDRWRPGYGEKFRANEPFNVLVLRG